MPPTLAGVNIVDEVKEPGCLEGDAFCMFDDVLGRNTIVGLSDLYKTSIAGVNIVGEVKERGYLESSDL